MLTACDKRPACHLVLCRRDNPVEQDSGGLDSKFFFFSPQPVTFSQPFSLLADSEKGSQQVRVSNTFLPHIYPRSTKRPSGCEDVKH